MTAAPPRDFALAALRIVAGLMFVQHGLQKHFGLLLPPSRPWQGPPEIFSQLWFAGAIEIVAGTLIALGLFSRLAAFIASGQMAVAYFQVHQLRGFFPAANGGELAVLYCFVFLAYAAHGRTRFSVENVVRRSRLSSAATVADQP